jgi:hypothetical protein
MFTPTLPALIFERTPRGIPWTKHFAAEGRLRCGPETLQVLLRSSPWECRRLVGGSGSMAGGEVTRPRCLALPIF